MKILKQNHIKYALYMCAVVVFCLLMMEVTGQNDQFSTSPFTIFYTFLAPFIVWYFGIKARKDMQKGKLRYKEGVAEGFKIAVAYALISPFVFLAYYQINPGILEYVKKVYQMPNASDTDIILWDLGIQVVSAVVFGTIYGAIVTVFLKSK